MIIFLTDSEKFMLPKMRSNDMAASTFKSNARETWHAILVSFADIYLTESLCILAERLS